LLVIGHPSCVLARRIRPPSLESYKDPAGVRGRRILYRILSRLLLVLYIGVGIVLPSEIIGLHWRRIRPDPGPDPHLKCHRIRRIRLDLPRMRGRGAPDPHLKGHRIRRIRLGSQRVGRPSALAPHLKYRGSAALRSQERFCPGLMATPLLLARACISGRRGRGPSAGGTSDRCRSRRICEPL